MRSPIGGSSAKWRGEWASARRFPYREASEIFDEIRGSANARTDYDVRGISHARLAREGALTWPLAPEDGAVEAKRVTSRRTAACVFPPPTAGRGFWARPYLPNAEMPDDDFPLVLLTGRVAHQWHTRTKTGKVPSLNRLNPAPFLEITWTTPRPWTLAKETWCALPPGAENLRLPARPSANLQPGCCWAPMHWNDLFAPGVAVNEITSETSCPESHQPELKYCPVRVEAWHEAPIAAPDAMPVLGRA